MEQVRDLQSNGDPKRSIFLIGDYGAQPWNRDRSIKEPLEAGLRVVFAKLASDHSETILPKIHRDSDPSSDARLLPHATEILPDLPGDISDA
ncbi:MAG: hypothetical protein WCD76_12850, partial [Pyrinomonadaceae bacterium]